MKKRPRLSIGTILTLCLTAAVAAGCVFLFGKMRAKDIGVRMSAQRVIGAMGAIIQSSGQSPMPQSTVRTVTVTLAPAQTAHPTAAPVQTQTPAEPEARKSYSFSITAGGLLAFQSDISDSLYRKEDRAADYRPVVSLIGSRICADLNLVTLPQVINTADRKYGDALVLAEGADAIRAMGVDDVILATDHVLDQGAEGAQATVSALRERGLSCGGINGEGTAQNRIIHLNGAKIAILSYAETLTAKGKNILNSQGGIMRLFQLEEALQDVRTARQQGADCVIVCLYWGRPEAASVTAIQRNAARALAEAGADVILGTRPSRVLPMELISCVGEDGKARQAFVAYSLGTLLTESREGYDISGMLLHLGITCDAQGRIRFDSAEYTPTYIWRQNINGSMQYRIVCSADPAPEGMGDQQKEVMARALNRIQSILKDSPVTRRK